MTHGSLFSGIGGFDLAAEWCGFHNIWQCEMDSFCAENLRYQFPEAILYDDVTKLKINELQPVDIISGGFPCQAFSFAGKRKGTEDDRYLWPPMLEVIRHIQPRWVVAENVVGIASSPIAPGEAEVVGETVLLRVIRDLWKAGYRFPTMPDGTPIVSVIPACSVGAPHRRDRVWIVAHHYSIGKLEQERVQRYIREWHWNHNSTTEQAAQFGLTANPHGQPWNQRCFSGFEELSEYLKYDRKRILSRSDTLHADHREATIRNRHGRFSNTPGTEKISRLDGCNPSSHERAWVRPWLEVALATCIRGVDDGLPREMAGTTKNTRSQLKAYGNSIVPALAFNVFQFIKHVEDVLE